MEIIQYGNSPTVFLATSGAPKVTGRNIPSNGGLYDTGGKNRLASFDYDYAEALDENNIVVSNSVECGYCVFSFSGKEIIPYSYDDILMCGGCIITLDAVGSIKTPHVTDTENSDSEDVNTDDETGYDGDLYDEGYFEVVTFEADVFDTSGNLLRTGNLTSSQDVSGEEEDYEYDYSGLIETDGKYLIVSDSTGRKFGVDDSYFNVIIQPAWDEIQAADTNSFIVSKNGKYGVIDIKGKIIIPAEYNIIHANIDEQQHTTYSATSAKGAFLFDSVGKKIFHSKEYGSVTFENGFIKVTGKDKKTHLLDKKGKDFIPPANHINWNPKSRLFECSDDKYTIYDPYDSFFFHSPDACYTLEGKKVSLPGVQILYPVSADRYVGVTEQSRKKMRVLYDGSGNTIAVFNSLYGNYGDKLLSASLGGKEGYVDLNGKWVWQTSQYNTLMD